MHQEAPEPVELFELVRALRYRPDAFTFAIDDVDRGQGSKGLTLSIYVTSPNSYNAEQTRRVVHYMPVPPAAYDRRSWRRWLFEQIGLVELHERMEHFEIDGEKPFAPHHGPGNDPYLVFEHGTELDVRTSFRGDVNS